MPNQFVRERPDLDTGPKTLEALWDLDTSIADLVRVTKKQGKRASIQGILSLVFSITAVLLAGLAAFFAYQDYKADNVWREEQISVLREINDKLLPIEASP